MRKNNQELGQAEANAANALDIAFLAEQTFGDKALEIDVLRLFLEQATRLVPDLPAQPACDQGNSAHLLKGSARGIGAWPAAAIAGRYEEARPQDRAHIFADLAQAFEITRTAIEARLAQLEG